MRYFILFIVFIIFSNCVSTKVFNDLESRYAKVKIERNNLLESQDSLQQSWDKLNNFLIETRENLQISRDSYNSSLKKIKIIRDEFNLLKENSNLKIQKSIAKNNSKNHEDMTKKGIDAYKCDNCGCWSPGDKCNNKKCSKEQS